MYMNMLEMSFFYIVLWLSITRWQLLLVDLTAWDETGNSHQYDFESRIRLLNHCFVCLSLHIYLNTCFTF
jgi:hypothetical protein